MASFTAPSPVSAEVWPDFGLFLGYRWGGEQGSGLEFGVEGGAVYVGDLVKNFDHVIHGGYLQVIFKEGSEPTLVGLYSGGTYLTQAELGIAYQFGQQQKFGLHLGLTGDLFVNLGLRYKTHLDHLSLNFGARAAKSSYLFEDLTEDQVIHGRPLRTDEGFSRPAVIKKGLPRESYSGFSDGFSHLERPSDR